jgi:hypothetical protein
MVFYYAYIYAKKGSPRTKRLNGPAIGNCLLEGKAFCEQDPILVPNIVHSRGRAVREQKSKKNILLLKAGSHVSYNVAVSKHKQYCML